jgi:hypothetical protein
MTGAHEGAVRVLVRKVVDAREGRSTAEHEVLGTEAPRAHRKERGDTRRLSLALSEMKVFGCQSVAYVIDADGYGDRLSRLEAERAEIERVSGQQPIALGVAVQTVEAWLLADETAVNGAVEPRPKVATQPDPESLWGPARTPGHPKAIFEALVATGTRAVEGPYDAIASRTRIDVLEKRCPSFRRLADELRKRAR